MVLRLFVLLDKRMDSCVSVVPPFLPLTRSLIGVHRLSAPLTPGMRLACRLSLWVCSSGVLPYKSAHTELPPLPVRCDGILLRSVSPAALWLVSLFCLLKRNEYNTDKKRKTVHILFAEPFNNRMDRSADPLGKRLAFIENRYAPEP